MRGLVIPLAFTFAFCAVNPALSVHLPLCRRAASKLRGFTAVVKQPDMQNANNLWVSQTTVRFVQDSQVAVRSIIQRLSSGEPVRRIACYINKFSSLTWCAYRIYGTARHRVRRPLGLSHHTVYKLQSQSHRGS